jgi:4-amino-4-deoxy-L-arabinose transferase-like glycosyltransferase
MNVSQAPKPRDRYVWIVVSVALVAALLMVLLLFRRQGLVDNAGDPYGYGAIARGFVEHGFNKLTRRAASLYPTFLSIVYALGGTDFVVHLLQCLMHAGTCALVYVIGRHLFNVRTGLVGGLFIALHPMLLRYVPDLHMEAWLTLFFTWTVWRAIRFYDRPSILNGVLLGVIGMVGTLTKGVLLPVLLAFACAWALRWWRKAPGAVGSLPGVIAMVVTMAALLAPWTYRNYSVSGKPVLLTPGTPDAFLRGYIFTRLEFATLQKPPYTDAENECNALFRQIAKDAGTTWELDELADDVNNSRVMKRWIVERPFDTARKVLVGIFTFWYEMTSLKNSLIPFTLAVGSWILAAIGMKRAHRESKPYWLVLLPVVVTNLFVALLIPLGRYSVPVLPCLSVLAAFGLDTLLARRTSGHSTAPA